MKAANTNRLPQTAPIDLLLTRLSKVRQAGPGRWLACCPAHEDRSPSMTVRLLDDGRILLHDFGAGCDVSAIVGAIGLTLADLFPKTIPENGRKPERAPFNALDVLKAVRFEISVAGIAIAQLLAGAPLSDTDLQRLRLAHTRLCEAVRLAGGGHA